MSFFVIAGAKDVLREAIEESRKRLEEIEVSCALSRRADLENQYLDSITLDELVRWIDALDRQ